MTTEVIHTENQEQWLSLRQRDVTSTESAALFGESPYVTQFELYHRKRSGEAAAFQSNDRMKWGNRLEAAIAAGIAEERGWQIRPMKEYMRLPDERIGSSFDFMILNHPDGPAHLEIKNVDYLAYRDGWLVEDDDVQAPTHIEVQVQHQMLVSGFGRSFIGALIGGNREVVIERPRDEAVIAALRARIRQFWRDVDQGNEPAPVMPADAEAVIRMNQYAKPGKILDASSDADIAALVAEYKQAKFAADEADETAKVCKARLFEKIGDAEAVLGQGWKISASMVAESPGTTITPEMVGQLVGKRAGFRSMRITAVKGKR
ncbi:MAG: Bcep22 [Steroidobacteraceae bacterium]|jgi:putative phage-type endonuclease|nr:Bcep22 [Steroidobacteraceae bacterium]